MENIKNLVIATSNVISKGNDEPCKFHNSNTLAFHTYYNEVDFLGIQGIIKPYKLEFEDSLKFNKRIIKEVEYDIYGLHRQDNNKVIIPNYNEGTNIVTHFEPVLETTTRWLKKWPSMKDVLTDPLNIPSIASRIVTFGDFDVYGRTIRFSNTHINHKFPDLQKAQLDGFYNTLANTDHDVIATGCLNVKPNEKVYQEFKEKVEDIGLQIIEYDGKTYSGHTDNLPVDYIIVPEKYSINNVKLVEDKSSSPSHGILIADVSMPKENSRHR